MNRIIANFIELSNTVLWDSPNCEAWENKCEFGPRLWKLYIYGNWRCPKAEHNNNLQKFGIQCKLLRKKSASPFDWIWPISGKVVIIFCLLISESVFLQKLWDVDGEYVAEIRVWANFFFGFVLIYEWSGNWLPTLLTVLHSLQSIVELIKLSLRRVRVRWSCICGCFRAICVCVIRFAY